MPINKLLFIIFTLCIIESNAQDVIVLHKEVAPEEIEKTQGVLAMHSFGLSMKGPLANVLQTLCGLNGEPITEEAIKLEHNPSIELEAFGAYLEEPFDAVPVCIEQLMKDYGLSVEDSPFATRAIIVVSGVGNELASTQGLANSDAEGGKSFDNNSLSSVCWWLSRIGVGVWVENKALLFEKISIHVPEALSASMKDGREQAIAQIMRAGGVDCALVRLPMRILTDHR